MNKTYAVVRYGSQILIASIIGNDINIMKDQDFHKMFANLDFFKPKNSCEHNLRELERAYRTCRQ